MTKLRGIGTAFCTSVAMVWSASMIVKITDGTMTWPVGKWPIACLLAALYTPLAMMFVGESPRKEGKPKPGLKLML